LNQPSTPSAPPISKPRSELETLIQQRIKDGYRIIARSESTAQLVKPKQFDSAMAIAFAIVIPALSGLFWALDKDLALVGALGIAAGQVLFLGYVLVYLGKADETDYLYTDPNKGGQVWSIKSQPVVTTPRSLGSSSSA